MNSKKVFEVANYFIYQNNILNNILNNKNDLTNKKLNKLLYYAQAWFFTLYNKTLFQQDIQAWIHGPAILDVYRKYQEYGFKNININIKLEDISLSSFEKKFISEIWDIYGKNYDAEYLEALTHKEMPWINARNGLSEYESSEEVITLKSMKDYYDQKIK